MPTRDETVRAAAKPRTTASNKAAGARQAGTASPSSDDAFDQQLNVRFRARRVHQARRLAASRNESMQEFFDRLVLAEVAREQETLMREFEEEERRARRAREELLSEVQGVRVP